jgi:hypothetical protein
VHPCRKTIKSGNDMQPKGPPSRTPQADDPTLRGTTHRAAQRLKNDKAPTAADPTLRGAASNPAPKLKKDGAMGKHTARGLSVDEAAGMTANYHNSKMQRTTRIEAGNRRAEAPQAPSGDDYKQRERARAKEIKMAGRATASGGPEPRPSQQSGHLRTSGAAASRGSAISGESGTATQPCKNTKTRGTIKVELARKNLGQGCTTDSDEDSHQLETANQQLLANLLCLGRGRTTYTPLTPTAPTSQRGPAPPQDDQRPPHGALAAALQWS